MYVQDCCCCRSAEGGLLRRLLRLEHQVWLRCWTLNSHVVIPHSAAVWSAQHRCFLVFLALLKSTFLSTSSDTSYNGGGEEGRIRCRHAIVVAGVVVVIIIIIITIITIILTIHHHHHHNDDHHHRLKHHHQHYHHCHHHHSRHRHRQRQLQQPHQQHHMASHWNSPPAKEKYLIA